MALSAVRARRRLMVVPVLALAASLTAACSSTAGSAQGASSQSSPTSAVTSSPSASTPTRPPAPMSSPSVRASVVAGTGDKAQPLAGLVIGVDAGHNGANSAHPEIINKLIDAGFGQRKPCNTTGTSTNAGYSEHAFNWDVASRLQAELKKLGATVVMTRSNDVGVGPCIDKRAAIMNGAHPAVVISIHADGNYSPTARGFHVVYGSHSVGGASIVTASHNLAKQVADALVSISGMPRSNYIGGGTGVVARSDLAGTNLAQVPTVLIESGNMRQSADVALLTSASFRQKEADAIVSAIRSYLHK